MRKTVLVIVLCLFVGLFMVRPAGAEDAEANIGTWCWNMYPYIDIVCFQIDTLNWSSFAGGCHGTQHAPGSYRTPIDGIVAYDEYLGAYDFSWQYGSAYTGFFAQLGAYVSTSSLDGYWADEFGNYNYFYFVGAGPQSPQGDGPSWESSVR